MQSYISQVYSQKHVVDLHASPDECARRLDDYLAKSTQKLDSIEEQMSWGELVDYESHSWMLDQVDFLVETIGDESLQLSDELRSSLLQFLLTIANLNEQIRHKAALGL